MRVKPSFGPHKDTATMMELLDYELDTIGKKLKVMMNDRDEVGDDDDKNYDGDDRCEVDIVFPNGV